MKQHFKVGELVVIAGCIVNPELNGIISVIKRVQYGDFISRSTGKREGSHYSYRLEDGDLYSYKLLRKFYPPSTKTFDEIMQDLKKPVTS